MTPNADSVSSSYNRCCSVIQNHVYALEICLLRERRRSWAMTSRVSDVANTIVPMALISGVTPLRMDENTYTGNVVSEPATKKAIMKSSKLNVKLNRKPASTAGKICGRVTCRKVPHGVAYRSDDASIKVLSMPLIRDRTITITRAMVNNVWAAIREVYPIFNLGAWPSVSGHIETRAGFRKANKVTKAIRVAIPMTMPGIMIAT